MSQTLNSIIESLNTLSLEEKYQLWQILEKALFQVEEENWIEDEDTIAEIQQVREEYIRGEYVTV